MQYPLSFGGKNLVDLRRVGRVAFYSLLGQIYNLKAAERAEALCVFGDSVRKIFFFDFADANNVYSQH